MRRRARVFRGRRGALLRQIGREALVEEHDGDVDGRAQRLGEPLGRARLLPALAAQGQRMTDDHLLDLLLAGEPHDLGEAGLATGALDHTQRARDHAGRVGHRNTGRARSRSRAP